MDFGLKGKTALVCASSRGLGYAVARELANEGATLFLCARGEEALVKAAAQIQQDFGVTVHHKAVDLSQTDSIDDLLSEVENRVGTVDVLVNNVGGPPPSAARDTAPEAWEQGFHQIFMSTTHLTRRMLPAMEERGFGRIITVTSLSVVEPIDHLVVSTAMRSAVTTFSKTLSKEVAAKGVTVNTVMPGIIHTERVENLRHAKAKRSGTTFEEEMEKTRQGIPAGRLGRPEEFAATVAFLASERASYLTGLNIPVDGGARKSW